MPDRVTSHLSPLSDVDWPPEIDRLRGDFAGKLNVYRVMAHHPALVAAWETFRNHVVLNSTLSAAHRELVILRTAFRWRAGYEWAHHIDRGGRAGLTSAEMAAAAEPLGAASDEKTILFEAVDALMHQGELSVDELSRLTELVGAQGVLDLMATVGLYSTLAFVAKTYSVPVEQELGDLLPEW